jgi:hypothetical protein
MVDYVIAVRTYKRAELFQRATLRVLREQGLVDRLYVFVGSDISEYLTLEPDLRYLAAPVGGQHAIRAICDHFPRGTPIVFLDDDLEEWFWFDVSANTFHHDRLHEHLTEGFTHAPFTLKSLTNRHWMKSLPPFRPSYGTMAGSFFGAYNEPELITTATAHMDDLVRTVQYFKIGKVPWAWQHAGFKTRYATNPGGLQASGDRTDTHAICLSVYDSVKDWVKADPKQHKCGPWHLELISAAAIKKKVALGSTS